MNTTLWIGTLGSFLVVIGAALPGKSGEKPIFSKRNWLLLSGAVALFAYAWMRWQGGGSVFFVLLEALVIAGSVLMMLGTSDRIDFFIIGGATALFAGLSLAFAQETDTLFFIVGLGGIGLGYAWEAGTWRREAALFTGSILIASYSALEGEIVFLSLNILFAFFSALHLWRAR